MAQQPIYRRIQLDLVSMVNDGNYPPGSRIPSEVELATRYGVTRMTVRQAIDGLVADGRLVRKQGSGTYVLNRGGARRALNRLNSFTDAVREQGRRSSTIEISHDDLVPPDHVRDRLAMEPGAHAVRLWRLRFVGDDPRHLQRVWLPLRLVPELARESLNGQSLYEALERRFGLQLSHATQCITAVAADETVAPHLGVDIGHPLIRFDRLTLEANNRPVEFVETWSHPDYPLFIELKR